MVLTCNPDPDWFALEWIKPYLIEEGTPNPEMDGKIRYYKVDNGTYMWFDSIKELKAKYPETTENPSTFTFISANCTDNIPLMKADPDYVERLKARDHVETQRLLYGNWLVRPSASGYFKREWLHEVTDIPTHSEMVKIVRAYDLAATLKSDANPDPDYTASVKMAKLRNGDYIILDICRLRARPADVTAHILDNARRDGRGVDIIIPMDSGAAGKAASRMLVKEIVEAGYYATTKATSASKIDRYRPFSAAAQVGLVHILKGCANDLENDIHNDNSFYYTESERFDGGRKFHDDMVDSTGDAFMTLATGLILPDINLSSVPSMRRKVFNQ